MTQSVKSFIREWGNPLPYIVAHTSGSTGKPKEIKLLKSDMRASAHATIDFFNLNSFSTLYLPLSPDYIAGKMQIVRALEAGCTLVTENPSNSLSLSAHSGVIDLLPIVPSQIRSVLSSHNLHSIRNIIVGGAPIAPSDEKKLKDSGIPVFATYGMTETCSHVALRRIGEAEYEALPGIIFDTDYRDCLTIHSTTLSFGTLQTNDIISITSPVSFQWLGRYDNVINSGGVKIYPEEIERSIAPLMPSGTKYYVTSRISAEWGEEAVVVTDSETLPTGLLHEIKEILGHIKAPKAVIYDPEMKITSSQKILRRKFHF